jgi:hypothetical protein
MDILSCFGLDGVSEFLNNWGRLWYPDSWTSISTCGPVGGVCVLLLFVGGIASIFVFIGFFDRWLVRIVAFAVLIWSLPVLISGLIIILGLLFALALICAFLSFLGLALKDFTPTHTIRKRSEDAWDVHKLDEDDG